MTIAITVATATMSGTATSLASFSYPSPIAYGYPNMDVFAISPVDRSLRWKSRTISPSGDEVWNPANGTLTNLYGVVSDIQQGVTTGTRVAGQADLFVIGTDSGLWHKWNSSSGWGLNPEN